MSSEYVLGHCALSRRASALAAAPAGSRRCRSPSTISSAPRVRSLFRRHRQGAAALGKFIHRREPASIDNQTVIRLNRDTLYSSAVFDLDAGPVTITLPDAGKRFMSMQVINEDHYVPAVVYGAGQLHLRQGEGRHALCAGRRSARWSIPPIPKDVEAGARAAGCDQGRARQGAGSFEVPELGSGEPEEGARRAAGARLDASRLQECVRHQGAGRSGAASDRNARLAWGGNPDKDAIYLNVTPAKNDGTTIYKLDVKDVPVDGFWSVSVYNAEGYFEKNPYNAYTVNNITAKKGDDGAVAIQFGGCDGKIPNCLPIMKGWNYTVRLYRPRAEILDGNMEIPRAAAGGVSG